MDAVSVIIHLSLLRSKTRSLGIMLDVDKHTYVNVSNDQGPSPRQPNASQSAEKKPVPVPRSALLRADILWITQDTPTEMHFLDDYFQFVVCGCHYYLSSIFFGSISVWCLSYLLGDKIQSLDSMIVWTLSIAISFSDVYVYFRSVKKTKAQCHINYKCQPYNIIAPGFPKPRPLYLIKFSPSVLIMIYLP